MNPRVSAPAHLVLGLACVVFGALPLLAALGLVAPPDGSPAPPWVAALAGLVFVTGGVCLLIRALGGPDGAVRLTGWARAAQFGAVLGVFAAFAAINSWVAFGPGERAFAMSIGGGAGGAGPEVLGRAAFGFGAVVAWLCVGVVLLSGLKLLTRGR